MQTQRKERRKQIDDEKKKDMASFIGKQREMGADGTSLLYRFCDDRGDELKVAKLNYYKNENGSTSSIEQSK